MDVKKYIADWTLFERCWLVVFTVINIYLFITWKDTWIGLTASLTGMLCVILVAKGKRSNYWIGIVNILFYAYLSWGNKFYGEVMLNLGWFLPMSFYGLYVWGKNATKESKDNVKILVMNARQRIILAIISVISIIIYGFLLYKIKGNLPYVDSGTTVLQVIAMFIMARRYLEQWFLWILVDIGAIFMWLTVFLDKGNDITILVMWSAFLVNALYGAFNWFRMYKEQQRPL